MNSNHSMQLLEGCRCGRRLSDGEKSLPGAVFVPPPDDPESSEREAICWKCHAEWLRQRLFPNGFDL